MSRCSGTAPQKRPDPGHSSRAGAGGVDRADRAPAVREITGIIIGLVMMKSRLMNTGLKPIRQLALGGVAWAARDSPPCCRALPAPRTAATTACSAACSRAWASGARTTSNIASARPWWCRRPASCRRRSPPPRRATPIGRSIPKPPARKKGDQIRDLDKLPVPQRAAAPAGPDTTAATVPASRLGRLLRQPVQQQRAAGSGRPMPSAPARKSLTQPPVDYESPGAQPALWDRHAGRACQDHTGERAADPTRLASDCDRELIRGFRRGIWRQWRHLA